MVIAYEIKIMYHWILLLFDCCNWLVTISDTEMPIPLPIDGAFSIQEKAIFK